MSGTVADTFQKLQPLWRDTAGFKCLFRHFLEGCIGQTNLTFPALALFPILQTRRLKYFVYVFGGGAGYVSGLLSGLNRRSHVKRFKFISDVLTFSRLIH